MEDDEVLANPVWHALCGAHESLGVQARGGRARRYHPEVSIFGAVDRLDRCGWEALAELVGIGGVAIVSRDDVPATPVGWTETYRGKAMQLVAGQLTAPPAVEFTKLSVADVPEMLELVQTTVPGPFLSRTIELGTYLGVHRDGQLVAMAGERMHVPGYTEISAVCTHPSAQRQGLAGALTLAVAHGIRARGDEAFLHVAEENEGALRLYLTLGFELRRPVQAIAAQFDG